MIEHLHIFEAIINHCSVSLLVSDFAVRKEHASLPLCCSVPRLEKIFESHLAVAFVWGLLKMVLHIWCLISIFESLDHIWFISANINSIVKSGIFTHYGLIKQF